MRRAVSSILILYNRSLMLMAPSRSSSIYVYCGKGSGEESRQLLYDSLQMVVDRNCHTVDYITAEKIKEGSWVNRCCVIAFGGGYDRGFEQALGKEGTRIIKNFVQNGGSYLGMCAGAYWACDRIEFDKDGPLAVVEERFLKFYPGVCIGPAFPGFQYDSKQGVHAAPIHYKNVRVFDAYMQGGGYFVPDTNKAKKSSIQQSKDHVNSRQLSASLTNNQHSSAVTYSNSSVLKEISTLGTYCSLVNKPAAIVKCSVGRGSAVLSGIHLEFSPHQLDEQDRHLIHLIPRLKSSENIREFVFKDILTQLRVKTMDRVISLGEEDFTDCVIYQSLPMKRPKWISI